MHRNNKVWVVDDDSSIRWVLERALTQAGIAVLRFDFTGLGESEGDFAVTNFSSNVEDLVAAAEFLEESGDIVPAAVNSMPAVSHITLAAEEIEPLPTRQPHSLAAEAYFASGIDINDHCR